MNPQCVRTSVVALWELALQWMAIYYFVVLVRFFLVSYFLYFVFISFVINRLCEEGINGKDQRAEKILLSLAPLAEAKIEDRWWQTSVKAHHLMARSERDHHREVE